MWVCTPTSPAETQSHPQHAKLNSSVVKVFFFLIQIWQPLDFVLPATPIGRNGWLPTPISISLLFSSMLCVCVCARALVSSSSVTTFMRAYSSISSWDSYSPCSSSISSKKWVIHWNQKHGENGCLQNICENEKHITYQLKENCDWVTAVVINPPHKGKKNMNATYHKNLEIALRRCSDGHMLAAHLLAWVLQVHATNIVFPFVYMNGQNWWVCQCVAILL